MGKSKQIEVSRGSFPTIIEINGGLWSQHVTISLRVNVYSTHMQKIERMPGPPRARLTGRLHEGEWIQYTQSKYYIFRYQNEGIIS